MISSLFRIKVLTALRIPTHSNFEETAGDGKNLALMDIQPRERLIEFSRRSNELTKVASIHLSLLWF